MGMGDGSTYGGSNPLLEDGVRYLIVVLEQAARPSNRAFSAMFDIATKTQCKFLGVMTGMQEFISYSRAPAFATIRVSEIHGQRTCTKRAE
jgi:hypothetical protein